MFVLGTAGHIDHGKSVLVKALTGIDPDRLREEKERGMTIDLGFAWLKLPSGQEVGIVDVPGHERFIKNMLAGVGGIDLAMLIVAANEGVMPQTREHLAILDLLEVKKGVVAITKKDLVDDEWLELIRLDVEELLSATSLAGAPVVAVSALNGEGLDELVSILDELLSSAEPRKDMGRPRLPVDRIFTIAGSGTVITGTLMDGSLTLNQEVEIVPGGLKSRIRGLQTHKSRVDTATLGSRVAVNLVGIAKTQINRGDVLATPGWLKPTRMVSAKLRLLPDIRRPLPHNATVSFHTGAAETMAKVRVLEKDKLEAGETAWVQFQLTEPVAVVKDDHFIIRSTMETIGGGRIVDTYSKRLRRFRPAIIEGLEVKQEGTSEEVVVTLLEALQPMELAALLNKTELPADEARLAVDSLLQEGRIVSVGQREQLLLFTASGWQKLGSRAVDALEDFHKKYPARSGMPRAELGSRLKLGKYAPDVWQKLSADAVVKQEGMTVSLPSFEVKLTQSQQNSIDVFLRALSENPYAPGSDKIPEPDLLNLLIERGEVVKLADNVVFSTAAYNEMVEKVVSLIKKQGKTTLAEIRDLLKTSRRYVQVLLEHMDEKKITRRVGDERVLY